MLAVDSEQTQDDDDDESEQHAQRIMRPLSRVPSCHRWHRIVRRPSYRTIGSRSANAASARGWPRGLRMDEIQEQRNQA
jgi:hypothetical protein